MQAMDGFDTFFSFNKLYISSFVNLAKSIGRNVRKDFIILP